MAGGNADFKIVSVSVINMLSGLGSLILGLELFPPIFGGVIGKVRVEGGA